MTDKRIVNVLLIEDELADATLIRNALSEEDENQIIIRHVDRLSSAIDLLEKEEFDVILSDLSLPDSQGIETFENLHTRIPNIPIIV